MKIGIKKVELFCLGPIYFPEEKEIINNKRKSSKININNYKYSYEYFKECKTINSLKLIPLKISSIDKTCILRINNNLMEISFRMHNQKLNNFEQKFKYIKKAFNIETKSKTSIGDISMTINFFLSDIEFMFYHGDFSSNINNNDEVDLYIYLKKFYYECVFKRKKNDKIKELIFPIFPFINLDNQIENLKFHDIVIKIKITNKDLLDLIIKFEYLFKTVYSLNDKKIEYDEDNQEETQEEEEKEEEDENNYYYETSVSLDTNNLDIIWLLLSLVSEKFITFYTLIKFINKYNEEIKELIKDPFLFIIKLRNILETKYELTYNHIRLYNEKSLLEFLRKFPSKLNDKQQKEYDKIKMIYAQNNIMNKYFYYTWVITPLTCYFEIPFLKKGIYLIDKYKEKIQSYDLISINFKEYKRINKIDENSGYIKIDTNIFNNYVFDIINNSHSFFNLNYEYLGSSLDDIKFLKCYFINSSKKNIKSIFNNINTEKQYLCFFELLFSTVEAAYLCPYKSIKKEKVNKEFENLFEQTKNNLFFNTGKISKTLSNLIKNSCKIHSFNSFLGILNGFISNFSLYDSDNLNAKKRILVKEYVKKDRNDNIERKERNNILYIIKIFKYNKGFINNESLFVLGHLNINVRDNIITKIINNSFLINMINLYDKVPIKNSKIFLSFYYKKDNKRNEFGDNFFFEMQKALINYQRILSQKNIFEIPDSAILGGIIDEFNIMKSIKEDDNYILLILNNEKYKNKVIQGSGIIFKTKSIYYSPIRICKINFFDIEKYEKMHIHNANMAKKIKKIKELRNVIIFPKCSVNLFKNLFVENITQQEFFISWNKEIIENINIDENDGYLERKKKLYAEKEITTLSEDNLKKLYFNNDFIEFRKNNIYNIQEKSKTAFEYNLKRIPKIKNHHFEIDYKNLTEILKMGNKELDLNELELFYLEYIPKCTFSLLNIINQLKKLMYKYSINKLVDLLIGNININISSRKYPEEIEKINDKIDEIINTYITNLTNPFICLKYQNINKKEYLSEYNDRIFIIAIIIYHICYNPTIIKQIISKYKAIIKKYVLNNEKTNEEKMKEKKNDIQIMDYYDLEIDNFGVDYYLLFQTDKLIDKFRKNNDLNYYIENENNFKNIINGKYENFFEDFKILNEYNAEIKNYYLPEFLFYKYLSKLSI